jgi:hypothetical protein
VTEPVAGRVAESGAGAELGAIRLRAYGRADGALSSATAATAASRAVHPSHPSPGTVRSRWRRSKERRRSTSRPMASADPSVAIAGRRSCTRTRGCQSRSTLWSAPSTTRSHSSRRCTVWSPGGQSDSILRTICRGTGRAANPVNPSGRGIEVLVGGALGPGGFVR